jgi:hypothetical protein
MSTQRVYLVVSADRRVRAAKRPQIRMDEVAIAINLRFPDTWGSVIETIDVDVPGPATGATAEPE